MESLADVLRDLAAESADLDGIVAGLAPQQWATPTPAPGWSVAHQIAHLAETDTAAIVAANVARGPRGALGLLGTVPTIAHYAVPTARWLIRQGGKPSAEALNDLNDTLADIDARTPTDVLLADWRRGRATLAETLSAVPESRKIPWVGPPMPAAMMAIARIMETWAHGQDVADALGVTRTPTPRLRYIAEIGVKTRNFAYRQHKLTPPAEPFRIELISADGVWSWGPTDAASRVEGPALDFCLLVTQRRHRDDLNLTATGEADTWLDIAQAFAGPPGEGRKPTSHP